MSIQHHDTERKPNLDSRLERIEQLLARLAESATTPHQPGLLNTRQAADFLCCSARTVDRAVAAGKIRPLLFGNGKKRKHRRFRIEDLEALLVERGGGQ